ncbi:MAG: pseudouridine-5'-phosphate glycosidase [Erysipelotrichaceae bacterium]|jgi:pseudouridine-5'-phosphate glycosidase|nr:pseudouridine-5'-phosphate glycosidase [Bacilli bacterium]NLV29369.1 pseudouridine-5'-phosphate glycosidase [Erysipelotrichaceae bacterium]HPY79742.1 pseudouridine-5'-phosphate glycosidase [Bacilli bacterium]HQA55618.1 pseudouridine-5'-phosphate glycosidase [Bacilli bacterium]
MIKINDEVKKALEKGKPVVALESTIISHGMPYPKNVKTALEVEQAIREHGAIPATIGIINGVAVVGMTSDEIEQFGKRQEIVKVSRRDLPVVYAKKMWAATTVAATMIIASQVGIEVFVTGGIGGVHRHATETMDISADLQELAKTNVTVVCAGAKAILDLPLTLEYLETMGVPVLGFKTKELPAFYTPHSGLPVDYQLDSYKEAAEVIYHKRQNRLDGGILITNPIPEKYAMDSKVINHAIQKALGEAEQLGIKGKEVTPFLLKKIVELTGGDSLESNIHLVINNAIVGAEISKEYALLK